MDRLSGKDGRRDAGWGVNDSMERCNWKMTGATADGKI